MTRVNLYLDEALWLAFRMACLARHISASQAITMLIEAQLAAWQTPHDDTTPPAPPTGP
jgi:hypothetical protein